MASVQQLESRIGDLRQQIKKLEAQLPAAYLQEMGLRPGEIVHEIIIRPVMKGNQWIDGPVERTGRSGRSVNGQRNRYVRVNLRRQDGSYGRETTFYDWERETPQPDVLEPFTEGGEK